MVTKQINLTDNEKAILKASHDNQFDSAVEGGSVWVWAVIETSKLNPKIARGTITSLIKKGLAVVDAYEEKSRNPADQVLSLTEEGIKVASELLSLK